MKYQTVQVTSGSLWEFRTFYLAEPSEMKGKKHKIKPKGDISIDCQSSLTENDFHVSKNTFVLYTAVFHILHFHVLYLVMNSTPSVSLTITRCTSPPPQVPNLILPCCVHQFSCTPACLNSHIHIYHLILISISFHKFVSMLPYLCSKRVTSCLPPNTYFFLTLLE